MAVRPEDLLSQLASRLFDAASMPEVLTATLDVEACVDVPGEIALTGSTCLRDASPSDPRHCGAFDVTLDREFDELHVGMLNVPPARHGGGIGRTCMWRMARLAHKQGYARMTLEAEDVGRYAWARCGFAFQDQDVRDHVVEVATDLAHRLDLPFDPDTVERPSDIADLAKRYTQADLQERGLRIDTPEATLGQVLLLGPKAMLNNWRGTIALVPEDPGYCRLSRYGLD